MFAFVMGSRLRAMLAATRSGDARRPGLARLVGEQDASLRRWLGALGLTRAMRVHLAVHAPPLIERIGRRAYAAKNGIVSREFAKSHAGPPIARKPAAAKA